MEVYPLVGGLKHSSFFHILGIIIPTDFHIFQRGWNTNQIISHVALQNGNLMSQDVRLDERVFLNVVFFPRIWCDFSPYITCLEPSCSLFWMSCAKFSKEIQPNDHLVLGASYNTDLSKNWAPLNPLSYYINTARIVPCTLPFRWPHLISSGQLSG